MKGHTMKPKTRILKRATALVIAVISLMTLVACTHTPYDYDLDKYIKVGDLSKIEIAPEDVDALAEKYKQDLLSSRSKPSEPITNRAPQIGDVAVISYKCFLDETLVMPIPDNSEQLPVAVIEDTGCHVILGSRKYPEEIEKAILSSGISTIPQEIHVALPKDFGISDLAGKNVIFMLTVNSLYELILPEYTDEFIAANTVHNTVKEYEEATKTRAFNQLVWDELVYSSEILTYPRKEVNDCTLDFIEYYTNLANSNSLTLESYVERKFFLDLSNFHLKADEFAKDYTKQEMLVYKLIREHKLVLTNEEYATEATNLATLYGYDSLSRFETSYGKNFIKYSILKDRVTKLVADLVQAEADTEPEAPPSE